MTNKKFIFFAVLFLFFTAAFMPAFGRKENVIQAAGVVRLVGSSGFSEIVISGSDAEWYIPGDEAHLLYELQHRTVTVEGIETIIEIRFANGLPAGRRRELRKIKIIEVR